MRRWEVVWQLARRIKRRKFVRQTLVVKLKDLFRLEDIAQPVLAERAEAGSVQQGVATQAGNRLGQQNLAAMRRFQKPRHAIETTSQVISVMRFGGAGMERHSDTRTRRGIGPRPCDQGALGAQRGRDHLGGGLE